MNACRVNSNTILFKQLRWSLKKENKEEIKLRSAGLLSHCQNNLFPPSLEYFLILFFLKTLKIYVFGT